MNMNLYIVSVDLINGLYPIVLDVLSLIAIFSGVLVITTKNPVRRGLGNLFYYGINYQIPGTL
jgi:hypothetical protein